MARTYVFLCRITNLHFVRSLQDPVLCNWCSVFFSVQRFWSWSNLPCFKFSPNMFHITDTDMSNTSRIPTFRGILSLMPCGQWPLQPIALFVSLIINLTSLTPAMQLWLSRQSLGLVHRFRLIIIMDRSDIDILIQKANSMKYVVLDVGGEKFRVKRKILAR